MEMMMTMDGGEDWRWTGRNDEMDAMDDDADDVDDDDDDGDKDDDGHDIGQRQTR